MSYLVAKHFSCSFLLRLFLFYRNEEKKRGKFPMNFPINIRGKEKLNEQKSRAFNVSYICYKSDLCSPFLVPNRSWGDLQDQQVKQKQWEPVKPGGVAVIRQIFLLLKPFEYNTNFVLVKHGSWSPRRGFWRLTVARGGIGGDAQERSVFLGRCCPPFWVRVGWLHNVNCTVAHPQCDLIWFGRVSRNHHGINWTRTGEENKDETSELIQYFWDPINMWQKTAWMTS